MSTGFAFFKSGEPDLGSIVWGTRAFQLVRLAFAAAVSVQRQLPVRGSESCRNFGSGTVPFEADSWFVKILMA